MASPAYPKAAMSAAAKTVVSRLFIAPLLLRLTPTIFFDWLMIEAKRRRHIDVNQKVQGPGAYAANHKAISMIPAAFRNPAALSSFHNAGRRQIFVNRFVARRTHH